MGHGEECGLEPEGSGEPWEGLNSVVPRSSLFFRKISLAAVRGETRGRRPSDEALGFNIPFVWNEAGRSSEQALSSNFP